MMMNYGVVALVTKIPGRCAGCQDMEVLRWHVDEVGAVCQDCGEIIIGAEMLRELINLEIVKRRKKKGKQSR